MCSHLGCLRQNCLAENSPPGPGWSSGGFYMGRGLETHKLLSGSASRRKCGGSLRSVGAQSPISDQALARWRAPGKGLFISMLFFRSGGLESNDLRLVAPVALRLRWHRATAPNSRNHTWPTTRNAVSDPDHIFCNRTLIKLLGRKSPRAHEAFFQPVEASPRVRLVSVHSQFIPAPPQSLMGLWDDSPVIFDSLPRCVFKDAQRRGK